MSTPHLYSAPLPNNDKTGPVIACQLRGGIICAKNVGLIASALTHYPAQSRVALLLDML